MDAIWSPRVLDQGLDALLERNFWYDLMLLGPWNPGAGLQAVRRPCEPLRGRRDPAHEAELYEPAVEAAV